MSFATIVTALAVGVGPTFAPTEPVWGPQITSYSNFTAAWNGTGYLALWSDRREGALHRLYVSRLSRSGEPLDRAGIAVVPSSSDGGRLTWNGTNYIATWFDSPSALVKVVKMAVVTAIGTVMAPRQLASSELPTYPVIASSGATSLVAWVEYRGEYPFTKAMRAIRIGADGQNLDPAPMSLGDLPAGTEALAVSADRGAFLLVWKASPVGGSDGEIFGLRVPAQGAVPTSPVTIAAGLSQRRLAGTVWGGTHHNVVWGEQYQIAGSYSPQWRLRGARIDEQGLLLDPGGLVLHDEGGVGFVRLFRTHLGATLHYGVAKVEVTAPQGFTPHFAQLDNAGRPVPLAPFPVSATEFVAGADETLTLSAEQIQPNMSPSILKANLLGIDLQPNGATVAVATASNVQHSPSVSLSASGALVVWQDSRDDFRQDIYAARVSGDGRGLDGTGFPVARGPGRRSLPRVAANGTGYLVSWIDSGSVRAARVTPEGGVLGDLGVLGATGAGTLISASASDGDGFLLAWSNTVFPQTSIRATRLDANGVVTRAEFPVAQGQGGPVDMVWNGQSYFVVWSGAPEGKPAGIYGARVSAAGDLLDAQPLGLVSDSQVQRTSAPTVAWNGTHQLVVWRAAAPDPASTMPTTAFGVRFTRDGQRVDASPVLLAAGVADRAAAPEVAWDGTRYVLAWVTRPDTDTIGLRARHFSADLQPIDPPEGIAVANEASTTLEPGLAAGDGKALLLWSSFQPSEGSIRLRAAFLEQAMLPSDGGVSLDGSSDVATQVGADGGADTPPDDRAGTKAGDGCSCQVTGSSESGWAAMLPLALLLTLAEHLRRRRRYPVSAHGACVSQTATTPRASSPELATRSQI